MLEPTYKHLVRLVGLRSREEPAVLNRMLEEIGGYVRKTQHYIGKGDNVKLRGMWGVN